MPELLERLTAALADRYAVESEIGRGGMAVVFLAEDLKHRRSVALKVLHPELTATLGAERFLQEIEIVAGLQHPHILPLYDSGEADGLLYYVMPYAEGESLRHRLDREGQLAVDESVRITVEVADGLNYAHRKGVVHRDIKPGNILLAEGHATIADFGIARAVEAAQQERITSTGLGVGTPLYASPEQATAQETLDGRTDIYSLGCVLYEMLAGEPPLTGATPQMIQARRLSETPTALHTVRDTVPSALDHVIARALARIPADRYATASQFGQALAQVGLTPAEERASHGLWRVALPVLVAAVVLAAWFFKDRVFADRPLTAESTPGASREVQLTHDGAAVLAAISRDGRYVAYAAFEEEGGFRIVTRDLVGNQPDRTVAIVDELSSLDWLPDGSALVLRGSYMDRTGHFMVPRMGGRLSPVAGSVFSPDGSEVLQWEQDGKHLLVFTTDPARVDSAGRPERLDSIPIVGDYTSIADVTYSPRGDYWAVATGSGAGAGAIRAVGRDGTNQRIVVDAVALPYSLNWRADGRVLYYTRLLYGELILMRIATTPSGEALGRPESLLEVDQQAVDITADGRKLITPRRFSERRIVQVRQVGPDSLHVEPIPGTDDAIGYFWVSPDARWVAFLLEGTIGYDIYKVPIEGGTPQRLTAVGTIWDFRWSPDSQILAFSARWQDTLTVWLVPAAGGSPTLFSGSRTQGDLAWAPGPLLYRRTNGSYWVADSLHVSVGGEALPLTAGNLDRSGAVVEAQGRPLVTNDSAGRVQYPVASPDGRWVAARWERADNPGLWMISLTDGTQILVQADTRSTEYSPNTWTPDVEAIVSSSENKMLLIPADGGDLKTVLTLPEESRYGCDAVYIGPELTFVCLEYLSWSSDAWLIENFDPHVN